MVGAIEILFFVVVVEFIWAVPSTVKVFVGIDVLIPTFPSFNIPIERLLSLFPIAKFEVPIEKVF